MRTRTAHASTVIEGNPLHTRRGQSARGRIAAHRRRASVASGGDQPPRWPALHREPRRRAATARRPRAGAAPNSRQRGHGSGHGRRVPVHRGVRWPLHAPTCPRRSGAPGGPALLVEWLLRGASPVLSSAILHYRFEAIHPFGDAKQGRSVLALWDWYRLTGLHTNHILPSTEYFWEDRPATTRRWRRCARRTRTSRRAREYLRRRGARGARACVERHPSGRTGAARVARATAEAGAAARSCRDRAAGVRAVAEIWERSGFLGRGRWT